MMSVLLGHGNGTFRDQISYSTGFSPESIAVGDFNNDNRLDIVVANVLSDDVSVLLGYGDGTFHNQTAYPTGFSPSSVAVGDFNNDTHLDMVVANDGSGDVSVLLGYGDGTFLNQSTYPTGSSPYSVAVGDFNNDTQLDIVVANSGSRSVSALLGLINKAFSKQTSLTCDNGSLPRSVSIDDFNNDDYMDIAIANSGTHNIGIFLGYGNISFSTQTTYSTGQHSSPYSLAIADFNRDTHLDIVVANYDSSNVGILLGYGNGSFQSQTMYHTGFYPYSVAVGDFDDDDTFDIIIANYGTNNVVVLLGYHSGSFTNRLSMQLEVGSHPFLVLVGDLNNDRKLDFTVVNIGTDRLQIYLQTC